MENECRHGNTYAPVFNIGSYSTVSFGDGTLSPDMSTNTTHAGFSFTVFLNQDSMGVHNNVGDIQDVYDNTDLQNDHTNIAELQDMSNSFLLDMLNGTAINSDECEDVDVASLKYEPMPDAHFQALVGNANVPSSNAFEYSPPSNMDGVEYLDPISPHKSTNCLPTALQTGATICGQRTPLPTTLGEPQSKKRKAADMATAQAGMNTQVNAPFPTAPGKPKAKKTKVAASSTPQAVINTQVNNLMPATHIGGSIPSNSAEFQQGYTNYIQNVMVLPATYMGEHMPHTPYQTPYANHRPVGEFGANGPAVHQGGTSNNMSEATDDSEMPASAEPPKKKKKQMPFSKVDPGMPDEEAKKEQKRRNAEAAKKSRGKKKNKYEQLEEDFQATLVENEKLQAENERLRYEVVRVQAEKVDNKALQMQIEKLQYEAVRMQTLLYKQGQRDAQGTPTVQALDEPDTKFKAELTPDETDNSTLSELSAEDSEDGEDRKPLIDVGL